MSDDFIRESNKIEGILRDPTWQEVSEFDRFMALTTLTVSDLERFVHVYQPDASLRCMVGFDVRVGDYVAPLGGPNILYTLSSILIEANHKRDPFTVHIQYENLHPFTDCNGRSGRMIWAWQMRDLSLGFLHKFYYQTLNAQGE